MRFRASHRLRRPADFSEMRHQGRRVECGSFFLRVRRRREGEGGPPRLGIIASRRVGNAVARNRAKRLFREAFRRHPDRMPAGCDILVIARRAAVEQSFHAIESALLKGVAKAERTLNKARPGASETPEPSP